MTPPPGWYPDPQAPHLERWWDGAVWTEHLRAPEVPGPPQPAAWGVRAGQGGRPHERRRRPGRRDRHRGGRTRRGRRRRRPGDGRPADVRPVHRPPHAHADADHLRTARRPGRRAGHRGGRTQRHHPAVARRLDPAEERARGRRRHDHGRRDVRVPGRMSACAYTASSSPARSPRTTRSPPRPSPSRTSRTRPTRHTTVTPSTGASTAASNRTGPSSPDRSRWPDAPGTSCAGGSRRPTGPAVTCSPWPSRPASAASPR